jgi:predicted amidohydrolase
LSDTYKVAAVQMNCVLGDKQQNLKKAKQLVCEAVESGVKLIVLPELFSTGYRVEENDTELAEYIPGETTNWMIELSKAHDVILVACILEKAEINGLVYDTAVVTGPKGIVGTYRKIQLWDQENVRFTKGKQLPIFDLGFARLGLQICYEVGFPEGARTLALKGADIIACPSAFGIQRRYAWDIATRSRALENGVFVIACNRIGIEKGETEFGGLSRVISPQGEVLAEASKEDEVIYGEFQPNQIKEQRRKIPYLRDLYNSNTQFSFQ